MKTIGGCIILLLLALVLSLTPSTSAAAELVVAPPALLAMTLPVPSFSAPPVTAVVAAPIANWTHSGCWTPRSGTPCADVYRDSSGQAWLCKACGTTGNPSPGKCTKISDTQLQNGLWCSSTR